VLCPGVNDGEHLERTLGDALDRFAALASIAVVPLGISDHSNEPGMRAHRTEEAERVLDLVDRFGDASVAILGSRRIYASDEYYLLANRPIPGLSHYEGLTQVENGIGMIRVFDTEARTGIAQAVSGESGFFQAVDGAPPWGYRAPRSALSSPRIGEVPVLLSGAYGARVLRPLLDDLGRRDVEIVTVTNRFFGGNISVAGLMTAGDISDAILEHGGHGRYVLPDVCLHEGRFLDGASVTDLPVDVEIIETSGVALRSLLELSPARAGV
jgi:NifB/MoaA-like Fe-S oxidoreductase